ncbi:MAG: HD domain-containing protein [Patescibacteria group bacterium]|nr:HD domain-containing protein [Patescibacteria group bacterium]
MPKDKNLKQILKFLHQIGKLKETYRFGESKTLKGDSSADHSWRLALMAAVVASELKLKLKLEKALKIALIHDLPEAITGDIDARLIAQGKITKEYKHQKEEKAMEKIKKFLPVKTGKEIYKLWQDYEKGESEEAKFIKALDKIETLTHFTKIEAPGKIDTPELLVIYGDKEVKNFPRLESMFKLVKKEIKEDIKKNNIPWKKEYNI